MGCVLCHVGGAVVSPVSAFNVEAYGCARRSLSALPITETELRLIAAAAIIGLRRIPKTG